MRRSRRTVAMLRNLSVLALFCVLAATLRGGGSPAPADPLKRLSPQSAVVSFLETCKAKDYTKAAQFLDLRKIPSEARLSKGNVLAQRLELILQHDPQFDPAALSSEPDGGHGDSLDASRERVASFQLHGKGVDLELQRLKLRSGALVWKVSSDSVDLIPQLAKASSASPLERNMPDLLIETTFFGTPAWVWLALLAWGATTAIAINIAGRLFPLAFDAVTVRFAPHKNWQIRRALLGPAKLLLAAAMFRAGMEWTELPPALHLYLTRGLSAISILALAWLFVGVLDLAIVRLRRLLVPTHPRFSSNVLPLLSRILKVTLLVFALIAVLSSWGYNTNTLLAGLGIGGIAIALAAQKTIENLFGGVSVVSDQPVFVGDFCKFGDHVGTVEDIGLRSTRIRTLDRTLVTVPNAQFSSMSLENYSRRDKMLFHPMLNLRRDTTPDQVRSILTSLQRILTEDRRIETGGLPVRFIGVGSYSLDVEVFAYILTEDGDEYLRLQQDLLLRILDAVAAAGTALALPTQASVSYSGNTQDHPSGEIRRNGRVERVETT